MGPVPAGKDAPSPTLALGEAGALEHVDKWQSTIRGGGGRQAGTHGITHGLKCRSNTGSTILSSVPAIERRTVSIICLYVCTSSNK